MRCIVCEAEMARYRCRYCKSAYCSSACFKRHRDESAPGADAAYLCSAILAQQASSSTAAQAASTNKAACEGQAMVCETTTTATTTDTTTQAQQDLLASSAAIESTVPGNDLVHEDADTVYVLQERHLAALAADKALRGALRSEELQKMLRVIDGSHSRLDALDAGLHNSAEFRAFCDRVVDVLGRVERPRRL